MFKFSHFQSIWDYYPYYSHLIYSQHEWLCNFNNKLKIFEDYLNNLNKFLDERDGRSKREIERKVAKWINLKLTLWVSHLIIIVSFLFLAVLLFYLSEEGNVWLIIWIQPMEGNLCETIIASPLYFHHDERPPPSLRYRRLTPFTTAPLPSPSPPHLPFMANPPTQSNMFVLHVHISSNYTIFNNYSCSLYICICYFSNYFG